MKPLIIAIPPNTPSHQDGRMRRIKNKSVSFPFVERKRNKREANTTRKRILKEDTPLVGGRESKTPPAETFFINDRIYGRTKITEPVLIELINSKPMGRLKRIDQHGAQSIARPEIPLITRFDHSVGVMILLKKFKASLEAQIAGLLHDISHSAFSHVIDYAIGDSRTGDWHEKFVKKVLNQSAIPKILKKYHLDLERVAEAKNYKLLELPEPNLCADRIDYFFRDSYVCYNFLTKRQIRIILNNLKVINGEWSFTKKAAAKLMAKTFIKTAKHGWYHPKNSMGFLILGQAIKIALAKKLIKEKDLFSDDKTLFRKLSTLKQLDVQKELRLLRSFKVRINYQEYDRRSRPKSRAVDPYISSRNRLIRLSAMDYEFKKDLNRFKKYIQAGIPMQITNHFDI